MTLFRTTPTRARRTGLALLASAATAAGLVLTAIPSQAAVDAQTVTGTTNRAAWTIKVPASWNHTLL